MFPDRYMPPCRRLVAAIQIYAVRDNRNDVKRLWRLVAGRIAARLGLLLPDVGIGSPASGGGRRFRNEIIAPGKSYCVKICILCGKKLYLLMKNDFQPIKSDMKQERDKLCYLTIGDKDEKWGVVVTTIGYQFIPPGTKYPLSAHPDNYSFMPGGGRILNE